MKKLTVFLLMVIVIGLFCSLYALDTGQVIGCDVKKSQTFNGAELGDA